MYTQPMSSGFGTVEERVVERFVRLHLIGVALEVFLILFAR